MADAENPRINTLYSLTGVRIGGIRGNRDFLNTVYYARGVQPSFMLLPLLYDIKIMAQNLYENGAIETRDLTACFYRFQRRIRSWLTLKRVKYRMAARPRLLLQRELGFHHNCWGQHSLEHLHRQELDRVYGLEKE